MKKGFKGFVSGLFSILIFIGLSLDAQSIESNPASLPGMHWGYATSSTQIEKLTKLKGVWQPNGASAALNEFYMTWAQVLKYSEVNSFRLSLEWSRLQPRRPVNPDDPKSVQKSFDKKAVEMYQNLLFALKKQGSTFVTLHHWNYPKWLAEEINYNGMADERFIKHYLNFVDYVVRALGKDVDIWSTFNEPNAWIILSNLKEKNFAQPKKIEGILQPIFNVFYAQKNIIDTHEKAYKKIHEIYEMEGWPKPLVSINYYYFPKPQPIISLVTSPFLTFINMIFHSNTHNIHDYPGIDVMKMPNPETMDSISFDYYWRNIPLNQNFWNRKEFEIYPEGLYELLTYYRKTPPYNKKPIIIAENGYATYKGCTTQSLTREEHLILHLAQVLKAKKEGAKVIGYYYWSLVDNFEWGTYEPRFGMLSIPSIGNSDYSSTEETLSELCVTQSFYIYKYILKMLKNPSTEKMMKSQLVAINDVNQVKEFIDDIKEKIDENDIFNFGPNKIEFCELEVPNNNIPCASESEQVYPQRGRELKLE